MLAEKAALLGRDVEDEEPAMPSNERTMTSPTAHPLTTPSELDTADPLSLQSPTYETPEPDYRAQPKSEKARGKMRASESVSSLPSAGEVPEIPDEELMKVAAAGVGPNAYVPTQEWVSSWQKG